MGHFNSNEAIMKTSPFSKFCIFAIMAILALGSLGCHPRHGGYARPSKTYVIKAPRGSHYSAPKRHKYSSPKYHSGNKKPGGRPHRGR